MKINDFKELEDYLKNDIDIEIPERLEQRNLASIRRAAEKKVNVFFSIFFRPSFVYPGLALIIIIPLFLFLTINFSFGFFTMNITSNSKSNIDFIISKTFYSKDVKNYSINKIKDGYLLKWQNPKANNFEKVEIIKVYPDKEIKKIYEGFNNEFADNEKKIGMYYLVKVFYKDGKVTKGIKIRI